MLHHHIVLSQGGGNFFSSYDITCVPKHSHGLQIVTKLIGEAV